MQHDNYVALEGFLDWTEPASGTINACFVLSHYEVSCDVSEGELSSYFVVTAVHRKPHMEQRINED